MSAAEHWRDDAICAEVDTELFFPALGERLTTVRAICARCPVATACAEYAITNRIREGVWGGLSFGDRQKITRARARA